MSRARAFFLTTIFAAAAIPAAITLSAPPKPASAAPAPGPRASVADFVRARMAGMHMAATLNAQGVQQRAHGNGDLKDLHWPQGLELWAAAIPGLFPEGSAHPQSRAKPEIWKNKADFDAKAKAMGEAAARITAAGKAGDLVAYAAAAAQLNGTCKACHDAYRGPER